MSVEIYRTWRIFPTRLHNQWVLLIFRLLYLSALHSTMICMYFNLYVFLRYGYLGLIAEHQNVFTTTMLKIICYSFVISMWYAVLGKAQKIACIMHFVSLHFTLFIYVCEYMQFSIWLSWPACQRPWNALQSANVSCVGNNEIDGNCLWISWGLCKMAKCLANFVLGHVWRLFYASFK